MLLYQTFFLIVDLSSAAGQATNASSPSVTASAILPTLPTQGSAASSVLATATLAPNLGNPANIQSYPTCAQTCSNATAAAGTGCDLQDLTCACGPDFRSRTAACEKVTCSDADYLQTQLLAQQLCGPIYNNNASLGSSVSSELASATSFAAAAVASKDVTMIESWPPCAQQCQIAGLPSSGCGSLANRTCVCRSSVFTLNVGPCERSTCSASDLEVIRDLSYVLCDPVGGNIVQASNGSYVRPGTEGTPTPASFTGGASTVLATSLGWGIVTLVSTFGVSLILGFS